MPQPQSVVSLHQLCLFELPGEELLNLTVDMIEERFFAAEVKDINLYTAKLYRSSNQKNRNRVSTGSAHTFYCGHNYYENRN